MWNRPRILSRHGRCGVAILVWTSAAAEKPTKNFNARPRVHPCRDIGEMLGIDPKGVLPRGPRGVLSFAY
jgi:hypothetical protein